MIIGKKIKLLASFLLLLTFSALLFSCSEYKSPNLDLDDILSQIDPDETQGEVTPAATLYRIVLPESASPDLVSKAEYLEAQLVLATQTDAETVYDHEEVAEIEGCVEILLGRTDRIASERLLDGLRINDYICGMYAGSLVLGGIGDEATVLAIDRFCREILPESTNTVLLREEQEFSYRGEYDLESVTLNGFEIDQYVIVFKNYGEQSAIKAAEALQTLILEKSGYLLDVIPSPYYTGGKYIAIGADFENVFGREIDSDTAFVAVKDNKILIMGDGNKRLISVAERFGEMLITTDSDGQSALWLDEKSDVIFKYHRVSFSLSTYVDQMAGEVSISKINGFTSLVREANTDFGLVSVVDSDLYERVMLGVPDIKDSLTALDGGKVFSLLYNGGVEIKTEHLYDCVMTYCEVPVGDEGSVLVFNSFCGKKGDRSWIYQRATQIAEEKGMHFVAFICDYLGTTALMTHVDMELRSLGVSIDEGIKREDYSISFDY